MSGRGGSLNGGRPPGAAIGEAAGGAARRPAEPRGHDVRMDLATQTDLAAGLGALGLAVAALVRDPGRERARVFAALCVALATWSLASAARRAGFEPLAVFRSASLLGGCLSGPLALWFVDSLTGRRPARARLLGVHLLALGAWASALALRGRWPWAAGLVPAVVVGATLVLATWRLRAHVMSLGGGRDARSLRIVLVTAAIAAIAGITDFIPRAGTTWPRFGAVALLPFLLALATVALRRRFVDVDRVLGRAIALALGAMVASVFLQGLLVATGGSSLALFVGCLAIVAASGPFLQAVATGAQALLGGEASGAARALADASRDLASAHDPAEAWRVIEGAARALPGDAQLQLLLGAEAPRADSALGRVMLDDRAVVTRRLLELDAAESRDASRRQLATEALVDLDRLGCEIAAPLLREGRLLGVATLGGGEPGAYVAGPTASALVAFGHQALATLERMEAVERSRQREALAAVGEAAASLAHDVRNPLGAIRGAAQVLAEARDPAQERAMIDVIDSESERLGRVLGDFLEWAKPRPPALRPVRLADLARRIAAQARLAGQGSVEVVAQASPELAADEDLLARALANLVRNARQAAGERGTVRLIVSAGGGEAVVRVEDDGPGLAPMVRERLFEPFVTTRPDGTGLGLPLVARVAAVHGGRITAEDLSPRGTAFVLALPIRAASGHDGPAGRPGESEAS